MCWFREQEVGLSLSTSLANSQGESSVSFGMDILNSFFLILRDLVAKCLLSICLRVQVPAEEGADFNDNSMHSWR